MAQAQILATVASISGEAFARDNEGKMRRLKAGDTIREGETVVAGDSSQVVLVLADGREMTLLPGQLAKLDAEVAAQIKPDAADSAVVNDPKSFQQIAKALASGSDLDALLEDPAAGVVGGAGNEGHSFVEFARIAETVDGQSYQFDGSTTQAPVITTNNVILEQQELAPATNPPEVIQENRAPTIVVMANDFTENAAAAGDVAGTYVTADEDGGTLTVSFTSNVGGYYALLNGQVELTQAGADLVNGGGTLPAIALTVTDTGGLTGTGSDTPAVTLVNDAPVVTPLTVAVSEEGLSGGVKDTSGTSDTTNVATVSGQISIVDPDSTDLTVTLTAPTTVLTSGGAAISWSGSGTQTLIGSANGVQVITVTIDNSGNYSVLLEKPVDHPGKTAEDALSLNIGVNVNDGQTSVNSTLTVSIEDDSPVWTTAPTNSDILSATAGTSLVGSLNLSVGGDSVGAQVQFSGLSVKDGYAQADLYRQDGTKFGTGDLTYHGMKIQYVTNADGSLTAQATDGTAVFKVTGDLASGHYTVQMLQTLDLPSTSTTSFTTISAGNAGTYNLVNTDFSVKVVGTGTATPTVNTNNNWFGVDSNLFDGGETLNFAFSSTSSGAKAALSGISFTLESLGKGEAVTWKTFDAAGGLLESGTVNGTGSNGKDIGDIQTTLNSSVLNHEFYSIKFETTATTSTRLKIDSLTGHTEALDQVVSIGVEGIDGDGDSTSIQAISVTFDSNSALYGTSGNDAIVGSSASDVIIGGAGNDTLTGGLGSDTFQWSLADKGTAAAPARDTITDFNVAAKANGGDALDLRDLLPNGATDAGALDGYLNFTKSGSDTVIDIRPTGAAGDVTQQIVLSNVDLTANSSLNDQAIIQSLLNNGKLLTD